MGNEKNITFKDQIPVDYTNGSWDDELGLIAQQYYTQHLTDEQNFPVPLRRENPVRVEARQKRRSLRKKP